MLVSYLQKQRKLHRFIKETEASQYNYQNGLDKAYFQHDMAYWDFKDLARRTNLVQKSIKYC